MSSRYISSALTRWRMPRSRRDHSAAEITRGTRSSGNGPLLPGQRERDALVDEGPAQGLGARFQLGGVGRGEFGEDALVRPADVALGVEHLVEGLRVGAEVVVAVEDPVVAVDAAVGAPLRRADSAGSLDRQGAEAHRCHMLHHDRRFGRPVASSVATLGDCAARWYPEQSLPAPTGARKTQYTPARFTKEYTRGQHQVAAEAHPHQRAPQTAQQVGEVLAAHGGPRVPRGRRGRRQGQGRRAAGRRPAASWTRPPARASFTRIRPPTRSPRSRRRFNKI